MSAAGLSAQAQPRSPSALLLARLSPAPAMSHGAPAPGGVLQRSSSSEGTAQSHEDNERKVRRREKNRVAAQRSRKKQTQKADNLHQEYECLEQENTSLKREIGKLTDEMKHLSEVLRDHEKQQLPRFPEKMKLTCGVEPNLYWYLEKGDFNHFSLHYFLMKLSPSNQFSKDYGTTMLNEDEVSSPERMPE